MINTILITAMLILIYSTLAFSISKIILRLFTKINFENSLFDSKSRNKNDIPNYISVKIVVSVISSVFILTSLIVLATFFAV